MTEIGKPRQPLIEIDYSDCVFCYFITITLYTIIYSTISNNIIPEGNLWFLLSLSLSAITNRNLKFCGTRVATGALLERARIAAGTSGTPIVKLKFHQITQNSVTNKFHAKI